MMTARAAGQASQLTPQRTDIQALRGIAVTVVLLYHANLGALKSGYLGVDIFFVVSGYLITSLIATSLRRGDFRLTDFWFRRAKRLLPAAYFTFLATSLLAPWFLNQQELRDYASQVVGAVTFTANIVLWQQTGYFQGASELKPLLHTWSLSLEEQYYLLLPMLLLFVRRERWLHAILIALSASAVLCIAAVLVKPVATFYLLPTRAWELLIGSAGAIWVQRRSQGNLRSDSRLVHALFWPSVAAILVLPILPVVGPHPGASAALICAATLIVILRNHQAAAGFAPARFLARIGDISYSLYLVHWPILALLKNAWVGPEAQLPLWVRLVAIAGSIVLAALMYRYVENPVRRASFTFSGRVLARTLAASIVLMSMAPAAMYATKSSVDFGHLNRPNFGLSPNCEYTVSFAPKPECRTADTPELLVWGDSYAMHLVPGLVQQSTLGGLLQATRSACGPTLGLAPKRIENPDPALAYDHAWAMRCIEFNRSVLEHVRKDPNIRTVVLASRFGQYVDGAGWVLVAEKPGDRQTFKESVDETRDALLQTVAELRAAGKKVSIIGPPPSAEFNIGACWERALTGRFAFGGDMRCMIDADEYRRRSARVSGLLDQLEQAGVHVIRFDSILCDERTCQTRVDDTLVYRDRGHLSHAGSVLLAQRMGWGADIRANAR